MKVTILFNLLIICFLSCENNNTNDDTNVSDSNLTNSNQIRIEEDLFNNIYSGYAINGVSLNENTLQLSISYSGGCGDFEYDLVTNGLYLESSPPQLYIKLAFAEEDDCEAWITENLSFNLRPIHYTSSGTIILHLEDWNESISYSY